MARDEVATRREKKPEFFRTEKRAERETKSREVSDEQLQHLALARFAKSAYSYDSLEEAFPAADPGLIPFGQDVLVQLRTPKTRTKGGLYIPEETRETDLWNMQVAKVIALGPVAFCNRETLAPWPEGSWAKAGDYVRVPKMGGDRWWVEVPNSHDGKALFLLVDDLVLKGRIPPEKVLDMVAYI